jgi:hypothetical protein
MMAEWLFEVTLIYHHIEEDFSAPGDRAKYTQIVPVHVVATSFGDAADKAIKADPLPKSLEERELYAVDAIHVEEIDDGHGRDVRLPVLL